MKNVKYKQIHIQLIIGVFVLLLSNFAKTIKFDNIKDVQIDHENLFPNKKEDFLGSLDMELNFENDRNEMQQKSIFNPDNDIYVFTCIAIYSELSLKESYIDSKLKDYEVILDKVSHENRKKIIEKYLMNAIHTCFKNSIEKLSKNQVKIQLSNVIEKSYKENDIKDYLTYDSGILKGKKTQMATEESEVMRQLNLLNNKNDENLQENKTQEIHENEFEILNNKVETLEKTSIYRNFLSFFGVTLLAVIFLISCIFVRSMSRDEDKIIEGIESLRKENRKIKEDRCRIKKEMEKLLERIKELEKN